MDAIVEQALGFLLRRGRSREDRNTAAREDVDAKLPTSEDAAKLPTSEEAIADSGLGWREVARPPPTLGRLAGGSTSAAG